MNGRRVDSVSRRRGLVRGISWTLFIFLALTMAGCSYFRTGQMSYQEMDERNKEAQDQKLVSPAPLHDSERR